MVDAYINKARCPAQVRLAARQALIQMFTTAQGEEPKPSIFITVMRSLEAMAGSKQNLLALAACAQELSPRLVCDEFIQIFLATNNIGIILVGMTPMDRYSFGGVKVLREVEQEKAIYLVWGIYMYLLRMTEKMLGSRLSLRACSTIPSAVRLIVLSNIDAGSTIDLQLVRARYRKVSLPVREDLLKVMARIIILVEQETLPLATFFGIVVRRNPQMSLTTFEGILSGTQSIQRLGKEYHSALDKLDLSPLERARIANTYPEKRRDRT